MNESLGKALGLIKLEAAEGTSIIEQLRHALMSNFMRVSDLLRDIDIDRSGTIDKKEFRQILPVLGLSVPRADADALFDELDGDLSGEIDYKELNSKLRAGASIELDSSLYAGAAGEIVLEDRKSVV